MSSSMLTASQADELYCISSLPYDTPTDNYIRHKSIVGYLAIAGLSKSAAAMREEAGVGQNFDDATAKKYAGFLEKKWTGVVRLQKRVWLGSMVQGVMC
jgi:hypothetical protein